MRCCACTSPRASRHRRWALTTEIIDAAGRVVVTATRPIEPGEFDAAASAEHRFDLPLAELDAGDYLLRFVATAGEAHAQRDVRFSVR